MHNIIILLALLCLSAFFSGSETSLFSLTGFQKKKIHTTHPKASGLITMLLDSPRRTLATILIGNMLVNITATSIVTIFAISIFGAKGVGVSIVFMTLLLLIFGEITPKTIAIKNPEGFSVFCCGPLHIFGKVTWPIRRILRLVADIFISLFISKGERKPYVTQKELKALVSISEKEGIIEKEEEEMIRSIFDLGERSVDEIMTPRVEIIGCEQNTTTDGLVDLMMKSKHTKIPIYDKTVDHIVGVIYTKEFMLNKKDDFKEFIKKPLYVPETEKIYDLLIKFQSQKVYIAVVLDEFGGTSGMVTLEDILEEIVGEIRDEYDKDVPLIHKEEDSAYTVLGKTAIRDVNDELNTDLPMKDVTTINGFLLLLFGRVPKQDEVIKFKNVEFKVLEVKYNMVKKARIRII